MITQNCTTIDVTQLIYKLSVIIILSSIVRPVHLIWTAICMH